MSEIQLMLLLNEWKQKLIKSLRVKHKPKICKRVATGFSYFGCNVSLLWVANWWCEAKTNVYELEN